MPDQPDSPVSKPDSRMIGLGSVFLLFIGIEVVAYLFFNGEPTRPPIGTTPDVLHVMYRDVPNAGEQTFEHGIIVLTGTVSGLTSSNGRAAIALATPGTDRTIANLSKEALADANRVRPGQKAKLICQRLSRRLNVFNLTDCNLDIGEHPR